MYYGEIKDCDIANGTGVRVSLFVSGCTNHCKNCFQPQTWAFDYGSPFDESTENKLISLLNKSYICGLTVLGGEPFEPANQKVLYPFLKKVKELFPQKTIWMYSGFTYEELTDPNTYPHCDETMKILSLSEVLVDGRYDDDLKDISLSFRGSSNQRIIDLPETIKQNKIIIKEP